MRLILIKPTAYDKDGNLIKFRRGYMPTLTLPLLKSITPKDVQVRIIDEQVETVNFDQPVDAVGITCLTLNSKRGYDIADQFRQRNIPVIMGGHHVTALPNEALMHCDSVVRGEGEDLWPMIINDIREKRLKQVYETGSLFNLEKSPIPDFSEIDFSRYLKPPLSSVPLLPIQATRGCPFNCDFCSVTSFLGPNFRMRKISSVIDEIQKRGSAYYFFIDDNIIGNISYARELFKALSLVKIKWMGQFTTQIVNYPDLVELAAKSGCIGTYLGLESISTNALRSMNKKLNDVNRYKAIFQLLHKFKIRPIASIIFGFDTDDNSVFDETVNFLLNNRVGKAYFYLLTPFPGTKFYDKLAQGKRILSKDWNLYDCTHVVVKPNLISCEELEFGFWKAYRRFYSVQRILLRNLDYCSFNPLVYSISTFYDLKLRKTIMNFKHPLCGGD